MLGLEQQEFYNRWLQKADNINNTDIPSLIDKYVTLFTNYNFLYNIVIKKKSSRNWHSKGASQGKRRSYNIYYNLLGAEVISQHLSTQGQDVQIEELTYAMPHFNIDLNYGKPQPR
jgi:hypothetical protein